MSINSGISLLKQTFSKWSDHHAPRLGASVAFYSLLSFAPLLILIAAIVALVFDRQTTERGMIDQARQMIGDRGADTVKSLLINAQKPASGVFASIIAFITLLFGASGVFSELRDALNTIWDAQPKDDSGWRGMVKQKLFSFGMVLSVGFLLLVSLILSAALAFIGRFFGQILPIPAPVFDVLNLLVSFVVITVLFALLFKYVPAIHVPWRHVRVGAIGTALLFTIGKFLLALYLGKASVGSAYGATGSLVAVIVWVYYSAQIFFFGAEFTRVYADAHRAQEPARAAESAAIPEHAVLPASSPSSAPFTHQQDETIPTRAALDAGIQRASEIGRRHSSAVNRNSGRSLLLALGIGFLFGRVSRKAGKSGRFMSAAP